MKQNYGGLKEPLIVFKKDQIDEINGTAAEKVGCTGLLNQLRGNL